ncbi:MAG: type II toxin-antitoxin system RelE/ParE family toxin [Candidatus Omnitrophica bacterium]|nr:type II toxin-antitoxin system RelE/ParE family toxin [Candidatus Omnitrophota bacterium]
MTYRILLTSTAARLLEAITDRRIREQIRQRIDGLAHEPELQGKPLRDELAGFRSLRAIGQRYRIIYRVDRGNVVVIVVAVGLRKEGDRSDIYRIAQRLLRLRLV